MKNSLSTLFSKLLKPFGKSKSKRRKMRTRRNKNKRTKTRKNMRGG